MNILYIGDLLTTTTKIQETLKLKGFSVNFINWNKYRLHNEEDNVDSMSQRLASIINKINDELIVIVDSFSQFIFTRCIQLVEEPEKIKKIIIINPITNLMYLKSWTIKSVLLAKSNRSMLYKHMYLFYKLKEVREDDLFIEETNQNLDYIQANERLINLMFNEILNYKMIRQCILFWNNNKNKISVILGDKNPLISQADVKKLKNIFDKRCYIIENSSYYHFWEANETIYRIISKIVGCKC